MPKLFPIAAATAAAAFATMPASAQRAPDIEDLGGSRYRISVSLGEDAQPRDFARAQERLRQEAERLCQGRGRPVASGPADIAPGRHRRTALIQSFGCVDSSPPAPTPTS